MNFTFCVSLKLSGRPAAGPLIFLRYPLGGGHLPPLRRGRNPFHTSGTSCLLDRLRFHSCLLGPFKLKQIEPGQRFLLGARIAALSSSGRADLIKLKRPTAKDASRLSPAALGSLSEGQPRISTRGIRTLSPLYRAPHLAGSRIHAGMRLSAALLPATQTFPLPRPNPVLVAPTGGFTTVVLSLAWIYGRKTSPRSSPREGNRRNRAGSRFSPGNPISFGEPFSPRFRQVV